MFHRGDADEDPHDHPFDFWTFPLVSYIEEVMDTEGGMHLSVVDAFRVHFRPARHAHRVVGALAKLDQCWSRRRYLASDPGRRVVTLVAYRMAADGDPVWGFWERFREGGRYQRQVLSRGWVPWRDYVYGRRG